MQGHIWKYPDGWKCYYHQKYNIQFVPTQDCDSCWWLYYLRHYRKEGEPNNV